MAGSRAGSRAGSQVESTGTHDTKMTLTDAQEAQERWCTKMRMSAEAPRSGGNKGECCLRVKKELPYVPGSKLPLFPYNRG